MKECIGFSALVLNSLKRVRDLVRGEAVQGVFSSAKILALSILVLTSYESKSKVLEVVEYPKPRFCEGYNKWPCHGIVIRREQDPINFLNALCKTLTQKKHAYKASGLFSYVSVYNSSFGDAYLYTANVTSEGLTDRRKISKQDALKQSEKDPSDRWYYVDRIKCLK